MLFRSLVAATALFAATSAFGPAFAQEATPQAGDRPDIAAGAAQFTRSGQLHVERLIGGAGATFTSAGGGCSGGVENLFDGHGYGSCSAGRPGRCCPVRAILLTRKNYW